MESERRTFFAHTLDISASGLKVILPQALDRGCKVMLEYRKNRARAVVSWSKRVKEDSSDHLIGMRLLDDGQRFWLVDLIPKAKIIESRGRCETNRAG